MFHSCSLFFNVYLYIYYCFLLFIIVYYCLLLFIIMYLYFILVFRLYVNYALWTYLYERYAYLLFMQVDSGVMRVRRFEFVWRLFMFLMFRSLSWFLKVLCSLCADECNWFV